MPDDVFDSDTDAPDDDSLPQSLSQVWSAKSKACNLLGLAYWFTEMKRPFDRQYPKGKGAKWPWVDLFIEKLLRKKYKQIVTSKRQQEKYQEDYRLICRFYRGRQSAKDIALDFWPRSEYNEKLWKRHTKQIEKRIERLNALADVLIKETNMVFDTEEIIPQVHLRGCRDLVKDGQIVTDDTYDLRWLLTLADVNIVEQAKRALEEKERELQQLRTVCRSNDLDLPKAA